MLDLYPGGALLSALVFAAWDLWRRELPLPLALGSALAGCLLMADTVWSAEGMLLGGALVAIAFGRQHAGGDLRGAVALGAWLGPVDTAAAMIAALAGVWALRRGIFGPLAAPFPFLPVLAAAVAVVVAAHLYRAWGGWP